MATALQEKTYNFGIYKKNGKRAILQLDFSGTSIYLIKRGHIKNTYPFSSLEHFDSEEGLHISLKFKDDVFEFDADNSEEKHSICRLLSFILNADEEDQDGPSTPNELLTPVRVIKEGLIEKKGNTTITTWNKRRLQITPGEFSYFKPGDQLALNIIQVWNEICHLKKVGQGSFVVRVREREYVFRVLNDSKSAAESEREQWMRAFHVALRSKRNTMMILDSLSSSILSNNDSTVQSDTATFTLPQKSLHNQPNKEPTQEPVNETGNGETDPRIPNKKGITATVSVHLSYVDSTDTLEQLPTANRPKPAAYLAKKTLTDSRKAPGVPNDEEQESAETNESDDDRFRSVASVRAKWQTIGNAASNEVNGHKIQNSLKDSKHTLQEPAPDYETTDVDKNKNSHDDVLSKSKYAHTINNNNNNVIESHQKVHSSLSANGSTALRPPPPPPQQFKNTKTGVKLKYVPKMKLKQVHWSKIFQVEATVWKDVRDVTERLDRTLMDTQFSLSEKDVKIEPPKASKKEVMLDSKRAQNLGIVFAGLKTDVIELLKTALQSTVEIPEFPADKLRTIRRYQPTADDLEMYKEYKGSRDALHSVDKFMMELCDIPYLGPRLDLVLTILDLPSQFSYLSQEVLLVWKACEELCNCPPLVGVLEYLLSVGNYLNAYSSSGIGAHGFQITSIDKVLDIKGRDPQFTLLAPPGGPDPTDEAGSPRLDLPPLARVSIS
ncbi:uncharacterized protein LOC121388553 [Gigantopelta aegis]|uniref:uncharacterized protein LOC121388553 n=1 Tax=Gigantopelta aegis TaxID=1735272 RepID=UPI001B88D05D|nr:uncharacterized protein LOC121388553 [Gigantopelta aegis]